MTQRRFSLATGCPSFYGYSFVCISFWRQRRWLCGHCSTCRWFTKTQWKAVNKAGSRNQFLNRGASTSMFFSPGMYLPRYLSALKSFWMMGGDVCWFRHLWHEWIRDNWFVDGNFNLFCFSSPFCSFLSKAPLIPLTDSVSRCYATTTVTRIFIE